MTLTISILVALMVGFFTGTQLFKRRVKAYYLDCIRIILPIPGVQSCYDGKHWGPACPICGDDDVNRVVRETMEKNWSDPALLAEKRAKKEGAK